ncbi:unnamed protein product [Medioppia subpectinata]|uniref:Decapping nuclease n=1 Tax=Medioppia subpectinata TaxID=1979941 RepID=A0A7R9KUP4_9ACAR|nr:unnamed protein product [Medioppia subpectinata]CAG2109065.1 unnamed protein product [Medioppia subpectinata]
MMRILAIVLSVLALVSAHPLIQETNDLEIIAKNILSNHHKLGSFRIEDNHSYNDVNCEQNVVVSDEELKTIEKMAVNLMDGFETSSLITDYKTYKELKWKYFLKWIRRSRCLSDRSSESLPHFVCFGGLFTSLLMTPSLVEDWTLVVTRFKDTIFMNKVRLNEDWKRGRRQPQPAVDSNPSVGGDGSKQFVDKNTYFAAKVTQIVTNGDKEANSRAVNEFEKCFNCYESKIGGHRLLLMSEMDAIDEEGNQYEIKCSKSMAFGQKLLQWWANCVVADIDRIIVGLKDSEDVLKEIQTVDVSEIPSMSSFRWNTDESFGFVNRCLNFIQEVLKDSKDLDTFRVVFRKRFKNIRVYKQSTHGLLPNWFTAEEEWDEWDHQFDTQTTRLYSHK